MTTMIKRKRTDSMTSDKVSAADVVDTQPKDVAIVSKAPKKKPGRARKKSRKNKEPVQGGFQILANMPLDVLYEVR